MTTEEFEKKLLDCLQGPNGPKIACTLVESLLGDVEGTEVLKLLAGSEINANKLKDLQESLWSLQVLVLLHETPRGLSVQALASRETVRAKISAHIAKELGVPPSSETLN